MVLAHESARGRAPSVGDGGPGRADSSPAGPYDDRDVDGGLFHDDYRAGSTEGDNTKLRRAFELGLSTILLRKIDNGAYMPVFPTYVVADDIINRQFVLALDESLRFLANPLSPTALEKRYAERVVQSRLHQPEFRARVIRVYHATCAVCSLKHADLLDAAHIIGDGQNGGDPCQIENAFPSASSNSVLSPPVSTAAVAVRAEARGARLTADAQTLIPSHQLSRPVALARDSHGCSGHYVTVISPTSKAPRSTSSGRPSHT